MRLMVNPRWLAVVAVISLNCAGAEPGNDSSDMSAESAGTTDVSAEPTNISAAAVCSGPDGNGTTNQTCAPLLWPSGVIPYWFDPSITTARKNHIRSVMDSWQAVTGQRILFTENSSFTNGTLRIYWDGVASCGGITTIGYQGNNKNARAMIACDASDAHELGHAIGFHHEHVRYDRDRYVNVVETNFTCNSVANNYSDNWWKCNYADAGSDFGPYNYDSIMQYGSSQPNYPIYKKDNTTNVNPNNSNLPTFQDGSNALQMYGYDQGWSKFFPLGRDVGANAPLDNSISSGVNISGTPALSSQGSGALDIYVRGTDGVIYHRWYGSGSWSTYSSLGGGTWTSDPATVSFGSGTSLVAAGYNSNMYIREYGSGAWGAWTLLGRPSGTTSCSGPALTAYGVNAVTMLALCDGSVYSLSRTTGAGGSWGAWQLVAAPPSGVSFVGVPAASSWSATHIDLFVNSSSGHLYHKYKEGSWSAGWEDLLTGMATGSSPAVAAPTTSRVDIFYKGSDTNLWTKWYSGGQWHGPISLGGIMNSSPAATSGYSGHIDVVGLLNNNGLYQRWLN